MKPKTFAIGKYCIFCVCVCGGGGGGGGGGYVVMDFQ